MYTLKTIARRSTALGMAVAVVVAVFIPAVSVFAASLTPLTERSLLLSSSAPGWQDSDGAGFSEGNPNPASGVNGTPDHYADPGSGPNGKKTGETFTFKTNSSATIKGFSFQYCTTAAGFCQAPGNNTGDADINDDGVVETLPDADNTRLLNETPTTGGWALQKSDLNVVGTFTEASGTTPGAGEFVVLIDGVQATGGWTMTSANVESEDPLVADLDLTGKNNMIYLTSTTGDAIGSGKQVTVKFQPSSTVFITNPGDNAFFVKINTYNEDTSAEMLPTTDANIVDGGVTVANVMTDSIHIVTKVLETMSFSVGIQNPDTVDKVGNSQHGTCEIMSQTSTLTGLTDNRLNLGNPAAEYSLETGKAWDVYSYWRLSSNSSGGATVYYSGNTLANTSGDTIAPMATSPSVVSAPGTEQFGLGFVDAGLDALANTLNPGDPGYVDGGDTFQAGYNTPRSFPFITLASQTGAPYNTLAAQPISDDYNSATGTIDNGLGGAGTAKFKFLATSNTIPEPIAKQSESVISCATAKMRYVGNIAADTPAGVYTTKINYLAAPQY